MNQRGTIVFDIIGTCFSLNQPRQQLMELGAPAHAMQLWFAQSLRDSFALSHAGHYQPLKKILEAELPRSLAALGIQAEDEQLAQVVQTFSQLELQAGAETAFRTLVNAGWRLVALTNGSEESTHKLLEQVGVLSYFDRIFSCDAVQKTKPHPDVYALVKQNDPGEMWMVAAHAWDIMGAVSAGLRTVFISQEEAAYLAVYPQPEIVAIDLIDAANQIVSLAQESLQSEC